jgi:hypothetical protein
MANTYTNSASDKVKLYEEIRCLRVVMERILRVMDSSAFVDSQFEKWSGKLPDNENIVASCCLNYKKNQKMYLDEFNGVYHTKNCIIKEIRFLKVFPTVNSNPKNGLTTDKKIRYLTAVLEDDGIKL